MWSAVDVSIRKAGRGLLAAAVAAGLAALGTAIPAAASPAARAGAARTGAKAVPGLAPGITRPARAGLGRISCPAASFCVAVGGDAKGPLAEQWNGRAWRVMPAMHVASAVGVSCTSARFCMAVGGGREFGVKPQIARWDGRRWTAMRPPPGQSDLFGVSCAGTSFCVAVGSSEDGSLCPVGAVWRGTAWHATAMPARTCGEEDSSFLSQVSCASASDCIAVGAIRGVADDNLLSFALAMGWNGKTWRVLALPAEADGNESGLSGVSCPTTSFCLATGVNGDVNSGVISTTPLALTWDGTTWTELSTPPGGVSSVGCASAGRCVTVSGSQALTWNGTTWTAQAITQPENAFLSDVSCWKPSACMAAGSYGRIPLPHLLPDIHGGAQLTLAERWNGSTWQVRRTPSPGDEEEGLSGVSCRSAASCVAVGAFVNGSDRQAALAERWNGRAWKVLAAADPGPGQNVLTAVSCPAARQCIAVGYFDAASRLQALAERWNGSTWTTLTVPHNGVLTGVSCPAANDCVAVGSYRSSQGAQPRPLSLTWDGSTWTVQASPSPVGSHAEYEAVTCPTRTRCLAVGGAFLSGRLIPLTALWNGTAWTMLTTPAPAGANTLTSVSCSRPSNCMAAGQNFRLSKPVSHALAESWDGIRWTIRPAARLKIKIGVHLNAVSCPAPARCVAVGGYLAPSGNGFVLAEAWNGTTWRRLVPITDPSTTFTDLYAISCPAASHCIAVGTTDIQRAVAYQWNGTRWQQLPTPPRWR